MKVFAITSLLALAACSADNFYYSTKDASGDTVANVDSNTDGGANADATSDLDTAAPDARPDGDAKVDADGEAGCQTIMGTNGCITIMNAFCNTLYNKCGGMTLQQCSMWWAANFPQDFDCNAVKYKKPVCFDDVNKCANVEIPSYMCGKLQSSTPSQLGGACASFFAGFP
jgi:hypothetical protein